MIVPTVHLTSDQQIFWQHGFVVLNGTIVTTWAMMIAMTLGSFLIVFAIWELVVWLFDLPEFLLPESHWSLTCGV